MNDVEVTLGIDLFKVIQQPPTTTDHHQQAAPTSKVLLVTLQMCGQAVDPSRQDGNLDLRGAGVGIAPLVLPRSVPFFRSLVIVIGYRDCSTLVGWGCFYRKHAPPTAFVLQLRLNVFPTNY